MNNIDKLIKNTTPIITDGGLETSLIYHEGIDLPHFAAFGLVDKPKYVKTISAYYKKYLNLAAQYKTGFILESPTWRANLDWGFKLGYSESELIKLNHQSIELMKQIKAEFKHKVNPILISGCIGPRCDGYDASEIMEVEEAKSYHIFQIGALKEAGADLITALTMTNLNEALGVVQAAKEVDIPVVISFTVETDGKLPDKSCFEDVLKEIDRQSLEYPEYFMINCAHPSHFTKLFLNGGTWVNRIKGLRANASCKSHEELDTSTELDRGNQVELAHWYRNLKHILPELQVYGGCCGTDHEHIEEICSKAI